MPPSLILVPTRACQLRCSYCPTVKDGWPELRPEDVDVAVDTFLSLYPYGDLKLFGGEPLLAEEVVRHAIAVASCRPEIRRVTICTNGLGLDDGWLDLHGKTQKLVLAVSIDGERTDHDRLRRGPVSSYGAIEKHLPRLTALPRVVVTQVIAPATAGVAARNFLHLLGLGFRSFKLLPAYYMPWSDSQIDALRASFEQIGAIVAERWRSGKQVYIRNLASFSPVPTYNNAMVVDSDRLVFGSDHVVNGLPDETRNHLCVGVLGDSGIDRQALDRSSAMANTLVRDLYPPAIWESTMRADAELTAFCRMLYPALRVWRAARRSGGTDHAIHVNSAVVQR